MLTLHRSIPLCPDLVVELASPTDGPEALRRKLADYMANGVRLGWLLLLQQPTLPLCSTIRAGWRRAWSPPAW